MPKYNEVDFSVSVSQDDSGKYFATFSITTHKGKHDYDSSQEVTRDSVRVMFETEQEAQAAGEQAARGVIDNL